jgi:hypothetical protein
MSAHGRSRTAPHEGRQLRDYRPESVRRSSRVVISTVEGPRFVPHDFERSEDLLEDAKALFAAANSRTQDR